MYGFHPVHESEGVNGMKHPTGVWPSDRAPRLSPPRTAPVSTARNGKPVVLNSKTVIPKTPQKLARRASKGRSETNAVNNTKPYHGFQDSGYDSDICDNGDENRDDTPATAPMGDDIDMAQQAPASPYYGIPIASPSY